ncbi:MAG: Gfo/Idh/MocA family oxidoreductase [Planctomycetales bacterium]|nr:Gfo/Idh/MocA family oxidoreductase [Planctomycetales bacterium]
MSKSRISRRRFLQRSAESSLAVAAPYWFSSQKSQAAGFQSANDRPQVGLIGVGGRGMSISKLAAQYGDVVAICDVDLQHAEAAKAAFGGTAAVTQDYRQLLDRQDVDVIINGTPDHWHTKINVDACLAGKDVYTEKPLTLTIDEGKILRRVVAETGRVVQTGTQQRSAKQFQTAVELVRNGRIGKLQQVWVALPWYSTKGGPFAATAPPDSLDWNRYQGQAPEREYCAQRTHKVFRWWYMYAGGIITDWGNHHVDIAQWGMDRELSGPTTIDARGIFPNAGRADCFDTPDRFFCRMHYADGPELLYFSAVNDKQVYGTEEGEPTPAEQLEWLFGRECPDEIKTYDRNGIMFIGDAGRVFVNRSGVHGKAVEELADNPLPSDAWRARPSDDHMGNFFQCVKTRAEPVAPVRVEHRTVTVCHLTNLSIRLGRPLTWDPAEEQFVGDDEANGWLAREQREGYEIEG